MLLPKMRGFGFCPAQVFQHGGSTETVSHSWRKHRGLITGVLITSLSVNCF